MVTMAGMEAKLLPYELPKGLLLEAEPFTMDNGRLTPTQKLKRHVVHREYRSALENLCTKLDAEVKFVQVVDEILASKASEPLEGDQPTQLNIQANQLRKKSFFEIGGDSLSGSAGSFLKFQDYTLT